MSALKSVIFRKIACNELLISVQVTLPHVVNINVICACNQIVLDFVVFQSILLNKCITAIYTYIFEMIGDSYVYREYFFVYLQEKKHLRCPFLRKVWKVTRPFCQMKYLLHTRCRNFQLNKLRRNCRFSVRSIASNFAHFTIFVTLKYIIEVLKYNRL